MFLTDSLTTAIRNPNFIPPKIPRVLVSSYKSLNIKYLFNIIFNNCNKVSLMKLHLGTSTIGTEFGLNYGNRYVVTENNPSIIIREDGIIRSDVVTTGCGRDN